MNRKSYDRPLHMALAVLGIVAGSLPATARVEYANDFATRTSSDSVPRAGWFVKDYVVPCALFTSYNNKSTNGYSRDMPYGDGSRTQDGWTKLRGNYDANQQVNFFVRGEASNPLAVFSNGSSLWGDQFDAVAVQTLPDAYSTGKLRFSVDLRGPEKKSSKYDGGYFRLKPLFRATSSPGSTTTVPYALSVGMDGGGGGNYGQLQIVGSKGDWGADGTATTQGNPLLASENVNRTHWYRFVTTLDLDNSTYTCALYDLGTDQPTPATATPAETTGWAEGKLYRRVNENGPVCGFGLHTKNMTAYSATSSTDTTLNLANCACADNIRVWWKPADSAESFGDANLVYDNDFATRRFRSVLGTASSTATADALQIPEEDSYSYRNTETNQVRQVAARNLVSSAGTTGCDGWKAKQGSDDTLMIHVVDAEDDGKNVLAFALNGQYNKLGQPIGRSITSGKVKCECDLYVPTKWYGSLSRTFTVCLGGDALASGDDGYVIRAGIGGTSGDETYAHYPYVYQDDPKSKTDVVLDGKAWYRVSVVADMETGKFDYRLYQLPSPGGYDRADGVLKDERTGIPFDKSSAITSLAIYSYASGTSFASSQRADNIRIWTGTDGTNWDLVYKNNFSTRVRYGARTTREATLLDADVNRPGLDGWMRRNTYLGDWIVREIGGDACLAFEDEREIVHAQHQLPNPVKKGKLTLRADVRPPMRCCGSQSSQTMRFYFGGDEYAQGEIGETTAGGASQRLFANAAIGHFGLKPAGDTNTLGYNTKMAFAVHAGNGDQTGTEISGDARNCWYRFVATVDLDAKTWRVDVYNQGAAHPASDDANGTLVQSFEDLSFLVDDPSGVSAFGLAAGASAGTQSTAEDTKCLLVDNVVVEEHQRGMAVIFR